MNWNTRTVKQTALGCTFTLALMGWMSDSLQAQTQASQPANLPTVVSQGNLSGRSQARPARFVLPPVPPGQGRPVGRFQGGASKGRCPAVSQPLTALLPVFPKDTELGETLVWGLTVSDRPTFWVYSPYTAGVPLKFVLQEQDNTIYETSFTQTGTSAGIIQIQLPVSVKPLEVGKRFHWYVMADCDSTPPYVDGWVERVSLHPDLQRQLRQATLQEQIQLYAANGIWYEALTLLANLRRQQPNNPSLAAAWMEFLQSAGWSEKNVQGWQAIAAAPLLNCCTLPSSAKRVDTSR